jgi:hypothetical protein
MKKFVFAFAMAFAGISLISAPALRAQDSDQITIKDPAEFNAYQMATTQSDPKAKAAALESFLTTYPQSVVKSAVLDMLLDTYQGLGDQTDALSAAARMLQVDPNNTKAVFITVYIKKGQCAKTGDAQTCDDAATMAQKGLTVAKPAKVSDDEWKKQTSATYPIFHSTIALDDMISKYTTKEKQIKSLSDDIQKLGTQLKEQGDKLSETDRAALVASIDDKKKQVKSLTDGAASDVVAGVSEYKAELMLYTDAQSKSAGLNDTLLLAQAYSQPGASQDLVQAIWFYARVWDFAPAQYKAKIEPDLEQYYKKYHGGLDGLDDIKAQAAATTFPPATFTIKPAPTPAEQIHALLASTKDWNTLALADKETVLAVGSKEDADQLWALLKDKPTPVPGVVIDATASVVKVAVTDDAKTAKVPDFIVNLKAPATAKEIPAVGAEFGLQAKGQAELDGVYDSFTKTEATDAAPASAQIVLRDGVIVPKKAGVAHKPTPVHKAAH